MTCIIPNPRQPDYSELSTSGIPGNIGIVVAKVKIWDHDPFLARPHQQYSFPFSNATAQQLEAVVNDIQFQAGAAFLRPVFILHDMFVGTKKPTGTEDENGASVTVFDLDLVGSPASGVGGNAKSRLPGGEDYEGNGYRTVNGERFLWNPRVGRDIFYHQLWLHVGSLLKRGVPIHPSEYALTLSERDATQLTILRNEDSFDGWTLPEIQSGVKWNYTIVEDNGVKVVSPVQISKPPEDSKNPTHWTLEKFTPTWQGEDFVVTIVKGDKRTTDVEDLGPENDLIDTNWENYKYLLYNPKSKSDIVQWVDGISNEAFYIPPGKKTNDQNSKSEESIDSARKEYWWKYKTYLLVEIGVEDPLHNYFIELVKGRHPRFLHLGAEWDHPDRLVSGTDLDINKFTFIKKCRVLSEFPGIKVDELLRKPDFRFTVRNNLGRLIITFEGYESNPWVINRLDHDPAAFNFSKILVPMVVPAAKMRIHGGNISATINWSPLEYVPTATVPFINRQADTKTDDDESPHSMLYMTFSHMGNSNKYASDRVKRRFFNDPKLGFSPVGYDCDAYTVREINKNSYLNIPVYTNYPVQYRKYGKGWLWNGPFQELNQSLSLEEQTAQLYGQQNLVSGIVKPHTIAVVNLRSPNRPFEFGTNTLSDENYPYKEYASRWDVGIQFSAGSIKLPVPLDGDISIDSAIKEKTFDNYITPIATQWRLIVLGGGKAVQDNINPIDCSQLVTSIQDGWTADGFTTINHEMSLRFIIPVGVPTGTTGSSQEGIELHALGQRLLQLHDKAFYVTVSYWWENGIGARDAIANKIKRREPPRDSDLLIQMTGIAYGATIEKSVNKLYMDVKVQDYMSALQKQIIFNSPFFDGVSDTQAVYELMKMAHFDDDTKQRARVDRRPLGYLQKIIRDVNRIGDGKFVYNGEESRCRRYDLPGSYADLANPAVKFQNGETFESALKKLAQLSSKIVYFDRWGVLRFENIPAIEAAFQSGNRRDFKPVYEFTTSPFKIRSSGSGAGGTGEVVTDRFVFDSKKHAAHLVYNVVSYSRSVEDCVNQIVLFTASNNIKKSDGSSTGGFIVEGYTFFEQIWDPNAEGFLGFRKPFYQSNGIFGGIEGIRNGLLHYAKMKYPPATISFQTYGVPGLKALDIVTLDDNLFYITEISHEIDPSTNNWWMNITGEWLKSFNSSLGFLEERGETDTGSPN